MQKLIKTSTRRFASIVPKATSSEAGLPAYNEKLAETYPKVMPYSNDYSNVALHKYFKENALIIPPEQIIGISRVLLVTEKANQRDYEFFLGYPNFLKVVDTLEKFSSNFNIENEDQKRNFADFKQKLYDYYAIQHRSIAETGMKNIVSMLREVRYPHWRRLISMIALLLSRHFVQRLVSERNKEKALNKYMLDNKIFMAKSLSKERIHGIFAGLSAYSIYHYLPYFTLYLGHNIPILAGVFGVAGLYTIGAFGDSNYVKEIRFVGSQTDLIAIKYCVTPLATKTIHAKPQNIKSGISRESHDGIMIITDAVDANTNLPLSVTKLSLSIPQEAWKDQQALDWVISTKSASFDTDKALLSQILESSEDYPSFEKLKQARFSEMSFDLYDASSAITPDKVQQLVSKYGDEYLEKVTDAELLDLYRGASK